MPYGKIPPMIRHNSIILRILPAAAMLAVVLSLWNPRAVYAQASPQETCEDGPQASGATYRICMPAVWNGDLVIYALGQVAPTRPVGLPVD